MPEQIGPGRSCTYCGEGYGQHASDCLFLLQEAEDKPLASKPGHCSCKCIGDCPLDAISRDGSSSNGLCTADELRDCLRSVIAGQHLIHWRGRAFKAERKLARIERLLKGEDDG